MTENIRWIKIVIFIFCYVISAKSLATQLWQFTPQDVNSLHSNSADFRLYYGNDSLQFGDLRLPKNNKGPYPVLIIIHGGCWASKFANLQNTSALADAFRDLGIATWNIEYRRTDNVGGGWPGTFIDIGRAADFLNEIANRYSLDLNHVAVLGHSAGGHLALWLAARHRLLQTSLLYTKKPLSIRGVILLGGVPDLRLYRKQAEVVCGEDAVGNLLGNLHKPHEPIDQRYKDTSPKELLPLDVPQVFIYGTSDNIVPIKYANAYQSEAQKKGDFVQLISVPYAAHHEYNVPNSITWPKIRKSVLFLLDKETN